jgi:hypothetical protein
VHRLLSWPPSGGRCPARYAYRIGPDGDDQVHPGGGRVAPEPLVLGGLFVAVTLSVVIQVAFFRATRRRVFRMAPLHHHFELAGWTENTVIVRFWLVTGMAVAFGLGLFYADWLSFVGL